MNRVSHVEVSTFQIGVGVGNIENDETYYLLQFLYESVFSSLFFFLIYCRRRRRFLDLVHFTFTEG